MVPFIIVPAGVSARAEERGWRREEGRRGIWRWRRRFEERLGVREVVPFLSSIVVVSLVHFMRNLGGVSFVCGDAPCGRKCSA